ncbi:MAG: nuclear transport factor 2 family protein [Rhodospirillaceae bacterium]|nr:nuclear transport factor 2 family protein [Rhodospirillaceae bacterium]
MRYLIFLMLVAIAHAWTPAPCWAASPSEVVTAERAFAAEAQHRGWIAAFKTYAAPDGFLFQPGPVNAQQSLAKQPDEPPDTSLKWWPQWAGIARSGDLGFTTGPFTVGETKGYGHYFTVWQKQDNGQWLWVYDGGPRSEAASAFKQEMEPSYLPMAPMGAGSASKARLEIETLEAQLAVTANNNTISAYKAYLADDALLMGSPAQPQAGPYGQAAELARRPHQLQLKPQGGRASQAGDFVFTYGEARWSNDTQTRWGHYVRIWQMRESGWKLVFDEILGVPPTIAAP